MRRIYLFLPILISIIFFIFGQNEVFRLSDPLDFLSTILSILFCTAQIIIWMKWLRRGPRKV
jgi:hypothetical protein